MDEFTLVEVGHPLADMFEPSESMQPWNESYFFLFLMKQIEECAAFTVFSDNVEVVLRGGNRHKL